MNVGYCCILAYTKFRAGTNRFAFNYCRTYTENFPTCLRLCTKNASSQNVRPWNAIEPRDLIFYVLKSSWTFFAFTCIPLFWSLINFKPDKPTRTYILYIYIYILGTSPLRALHALPAQLIYFSCNNLAIQFGFDYIFMNKIKNSLKIFHVFEFIENASGYTTSFKLLTFGMYVTS